MEERKCGRALAVAVCESGRWPGLGTLLPANAGATREERAWRAGHLIDCREPALDDDT